MLSRELFKTTVTVECDGQVIKATNDSPQRVAQIIENNYNVVKSYYAFHLALTRMPCKKDLNAISLQIVMYYLALYSSWKVKYTKSNYDIVFYQKDFDHPSTMDIVVFYLQKKYPLTWKTQSAGYLNMELTELEDYWQRRLQYFNM